VAAHHPNIRSVFPAAWRTFLVYASLHVVESPVYNPLQQLAYTAVVFLLAPLTIHTGVAMSPAVSGHFPGYTQLFGGRQSARSIHFLCLVAFVIFTLLHTAMVLAHGLSRELGAIALGQTVNANLPLALVIGLGGLVIVVIINYAITFVSLRWPRWTQNRVGSVLDPVRWLLFHHLTSRQMFSKADISTFFRVNGRPPRTASTRNWQQSSSRITPWKWVVWWKSRCAFRCRTWRRCRGRRRLPNTSASRAGRTSRSGPACRSATSWNYASPCRRPATWSFAPSTTNRSPSRTRPAPAFSTARSISSWRNIRRPSWPTR
jgi:hypothetical protein